MSHASLRPAVSPREADSPNAPETAFPGDSPAAFDAMVRSASAGVSPGGSAGAPAGVGAGSDTGFGAGAGKKRWPWVAAVVSLAALGVGAYAVGSSSGDAGAQAATWAVSAGPTVGNRDVESGAAEAMLDRTGADGAFIVTVTGLRCGAAALQPAAAAVRYRGLRQRYHEQLCLVGVSVENAGREARVLDGGAQRAVDGHGRAYAVVDRAAVFLNERAPSLLDAIPGGATVHGVLPFEIPAEAHLVALLAHESAGTRGTRIALS